MSTSHCSQANRAQMKHPDVAMARNHRQRILALMIAGLILVALALALTLAHIHALTLERAALARKVAWSVARQAEGELLAFVIEGLDALFDSRGAAEPVDKEALREWIQREVSRALREDGGVRVFRDPRIPTYIVDAAAYSRMTILDGAFMMSVPVWEHWLVARLPQGVAGRPLEDVASYPVQFVPYKQTGRWCYQPSGGSSRRP